RGSLRGRSFCCRAGRGAAPPPRPPARRPPAGCDHAPHARARPWQWTRRMTAQPTDERLRDDPEVIIPNLNWRYSGVTATNRAVAPLLAGACRGAWLGPHRPDGAAAAGPVESPRPPLR